MRTFVPLAIAATTVAVLLPARSVTAQTVESRLQNVYTRQRGLVDTKSITAFPVTFGFVL